MPVEWRPAAGQLHLRHGRPGFADGILASGNPGQLHGGGLTPIGHVVREAERG